MKTPHRITLIRGDDVVGKYDPITDSYKSSEVEEDTVPCHINFIKQAKVFEEYGTRNEKIMICRFMQIQKPFKQAIYNNELYEPLEKLNAFFKGAIRLKKVEDLWQEE